MNTLTKLILISCVGILTANTLYAEQPIPNCQSMAECLHACHHTSVETIMSEQNRDCGTDRLVTPEMLNDTYHACTGQCS